MIYADHNKWADRVFRHYLTWLLGRHFNCVTLLNEVPAVDNAHPLLLLPNHSTWWDGFIVYLINKKRLQRQAYLMMLQEQLSKNRFFRYLGAFSVDPDSPSELRRSLRYTQTLFQEQESTNMVCIFPQGELQPWHQRPIELKRGIEYLLKRIPLPVQLLFLGIRIEFRGEQFPQIFLLFSKTILVESAAVFTAESLAKSMQDLLNDLKHRIAAEEKGKVIFRGRRSVNQRLQNISGKGGQK